MQRLVGRFRAYRGHVQAQNVDRMNARLNRRLLGIMLLVLPVVAPALALAQMPAPAIDIATAPAVLVMIGDPGCPYCARFEREVAPGYTASNDGKLAPLVRRDRHDADVAFLPRIVYSPTFVMLVRGREIGRIVGYAGADLFWMQVAALLTDVQGVLANDPASGSHTEGRR